MHFVSWIILSGSSALWVLMLALTAQAAASGLTIVAAIGAVASILGLGVAYLRQRDQRPDFGPSNRDTDSAANRVLALQQTQQQLDAALREHREALDETQNQLHQALSEAEQEQRQVERTRELADQSQHSGQTANQRVFEMFQSMADISVASEQLSKLVRSIEQIAFETRVLSFNASLEASGGRAAQGQRFRVVAGEVGDLAQATSQAVDQANTQVESANHKVAAGCALVSELQSEMGHARDASTQLQKAMTDLQQRQHDRLSTLQAVSQRLEGVESARRHLEAITREFDRAVASATVRAS